MSKIFLYYSFCKTIFVHVIGVLHWWCKFLQLKHFQEAHSCTFLLWNVKDAWPTGVSFITAFSVPQELIKNCFAIPFFFSAKPEIILKENDFWSFNLNVESYVVNILLGRKILSGSFFGLSAVAGVMYNQPVLAYSMDGNVTIITKYWM